MNELFEILFGIESGIAYLAAQIFGFLGFITMALINYLMRDDTNSKFDIKYWIKNNWRSTVSFIGLLIIGMFVGLRFQSDIIDGVQTNYNLDFVKDKWFWFFLGGLLFRGILFQTYRIYKKLTTK